MEKDIKEILLILKIIFYAVFVLFGILLGFILSR